MSANSSIAISIAQLLDIRHLPVPASRSAPASNCTWVGSFSSRKRGHGTDYDDLRTYKAGDDIRHIDWRVSARMQELHTRLYREEKEHRICIICDLRPCMFTGSATLRANKATRLSARCLWLACQGGSRVTLLLLTPSGVCMMEPGTGHSTAIRGCALLSEEHQRIATTLAQRTNATNTADEPALINNTHAHIRRRKLTVDHRAKGPSLDSLLQWLSMQQEHKSTLLWLTALDFTGEHFFDSISSLAPTRHSVFVYIDEPMLREGLPGGEYHYQSAVSDDTITGGKQQSIQLNVVNRHKLKNDLRRQWQARADLMTSLRIPCISTASGDTDVISALRHQAYLP